MTSLATDVGRSSSELKAAYERKMVEVAGLIAAGWSKGTAAEREARAWRVLSLLIGGLTLARAVHGDGLAETIAEAVTTAASTL